MQLAISTWTHHLNHLIYSFIISVKEKIQVNIVQDKTIVSNGALLLVDGKSIFF
jgi:hypothetical protein